MPAHGDASAPPCAAFCELPFDKLLEHNARSFSAIFCAHIIIYYYFSPRPAEIVGLERRCCLLPPRPRVRASFKERKAPFRKASRGFGRAATYRRQAPGKIRVEPGRARRGIDTCRRAHAGLWPRPSLLATMAQEICWRSRRELTRPTDRARTGWLLPA